MKTVFALALLAVCGVAQAQSIGVNITAASGRMSPFIGAHRAYFVGPGQFVAHVPQSDGKILTIAYEDIPSGPGARQVIRVFLAEWRHGMAVTCSTKLPLSGGAAATIAGGGNQTRAGMGIGDPDGGGISLSVTP